MTARRRMQPDDPDDDREAPIVISRNRRLIIPVFLFVGCMAFTWHLATTYGHDRRRLDDHEFRIKKLEEQQMTLNGIRSDLARILRAVEPPKRPQ